MDFNQVKELLNLVDQSSLKEFDIKMDNVSIRMSKNNGTLQSVSGNQLTQTQAETSFSSEGAVHASYPSSSSLSEANAATEIVAVEEGEEILSPIVGVVYLSPEPGKPLFKKAGDTVTVGETICIVEAMKVMNEIKSEHDGVIAEVLVEDSQVVEYNQPLFRIV